MDLKELIEQTANNVEQCELIVQSELANNLDKAKQNLIYFQSLLKQLNTLSSIKSEDTETDSLKTDGATVAEIRNAFADYYRTEGCSCFRDESGHETAEQRLGELLQPEKYPDGSGFDWYKYASEQ